MVGRLKHAYKADLEALKAGNPVNYDSGDTPATPKTPKTPAKRTAQADDMDGTPKKRGRGRPKKIVDESPQMESVLQTVGAGTVVKEEPDLDNGFGDFDEI